MLRRWTFTGSQGELLEGGQEIYWPIVGRSWWKMELVVTGKVRDVFAGKFQLIPAWTGYFTRGPMTVITIE